MFNKAKKKKISILMLLVICMQFLFAPSTLAASRLVHATQGEKLHQKTADYSNTVPINYKSSLSEKS